MQTELRREKFEERFGAGANELDALEALHPGVLAEIVEQAILRFHIFYQAAVNVSSQRI